MRRRALLITIGALAVLSPAAPSAGEVKSRGMIAFESMRAAGLATIAPTGGRTRAIPGTKGDREPAWSPDGTKLAFASVSASTWTIVVSDANGRGRRVVAHSGALKPSPSWSPDGRSIAYAGYDAIFVVPAAGGHSRRVTGATLPWTVAWSPDGTRIAFGNTPGDSDDADIVLVSSSGMHRRVLVHGGAGLNWGGIAWSPDSRTMAVGKKTYDGGDPDGSPDMYLVDVKSGRQTEFWSGAADPTWSPDGTQIAAIDEIVDGYVHVMDVKKPGIERALVPGFDPSWSP